MLSSGDFIGLGRLCRRLPPKSAKMAFNWLKMAFNWLKMGSLAFNWLKIGQNGLQLAQNGLQLAQNRPKWPSTGSKWAPWPSTGPKSVKMAFNWKIAFNWLKMASMTFNWLKIGQNSLQLDQNLPKMPLCPSKGRILGGFRDIRILLSYFGGLPAGHGT